MLSPKTTTPVLVSVLVLNWNKPDLTIKAVQSLIRNTVQEIEIIVIDNGSDRRKKEKLRHFCESEAISFLDIGINRFFGEGNNIGAESASGEYLVFLNNDVEVHSDWLTPMLETICNDATVGAVGPKFLYPNGFLQEAGAFIDENGRSVQIGKGQDPGDPRFNHRRDVHYVSAACLLIRKSDFMSVAGFNFIYEPAYYEDTELCFSLRSLGKRIVYEPKSVVTHIESATTADPGSILKLDNISEINRTKFLNRWSGGRTPSHFIEVVPEARLKNRKVIGIYTPFHLTLGGGEKYILSVAEALSNSDYEVELINDYVFSRLRLNQLAHLFGLDLSKIKLVERSTAMMSSYDLLISMGNEVLPSILPSGKKNIFHCQFPFPSPANLNSRASELAKIDCVIVNSQFTKRHYIEAAKVLGAEVHVDVIHPPVDSLGDAEAARSKYKILAVGRFFVGGHMKRQDALITAFRELSKKYPEASLALVGGVLPGTEHRKYLERCMKMAEGLNVTFHIDAEKEVLASLAKTCSVYWHATGFEVDFMNEPEKCEHFGISVVEGMSAGLIPVAVGSGGPAEIIDFGINGFLFHTLANLIRRTDLVFKLDSADSEALRSNAISSAKKYQKSIFAAQWERLVKGLI